MTVMFRSGPRRVVEVYRRGVTLVQVRDGTIGGANWSKRTRADGKRTTTYTWSDLDHAGAVLPESLRAAREASR